MIIEKQKTAGEVLRQKYMEKMNPDKNKEYTDKATSYIEDAKKIIDEKIDKGELPIYIISSHETESGIIREDDTLFKLFQNFDFNLICSKVADDNGLKIIMEPRMNPDNPQVPILNMIITFK